MALTIAAFFLVGTIDVELNDTGFAIALAVFGVGAGLLLSQLGNVIMSSVDQSKSNEAGGLQGTAQNLGASLGTALIGAVLISGLTTGFISRIERQPRGHAGRPGAARRGRLDRHPGRPGRRRRAGRARRGRAAGRGDRASPTDYGDAQLEALKKSLLAVALLAAASLVVHAPPAGAGRADPQPLRGASAARRESPESYDTLVLSPGAASIRPQLPGIDLPGIFPVRTVPDARRIREWIERGTSFLAGMDRYSGFQTVRPARHAVVVGGGFIGLEMAENLVHRGFDVTVVELADQVLAPLDVEYGRLVADFLGHHGVRVVTGDGVAGFEQSEHETLTVTTQSGERYPADVVILALGVRPDTTLARMAGVEVGERGGIRVDGHMRTSDPDIFAVGDAVEVRDFVTGEWSLIALAGPANRQARIAADVIAGRESQLPRHAGHRGRRALRR